MNDQIVNNSNISCNLFLDWKLNNWRDIYANQLYIIQPKASGFPDFLPQVIIFDNTFKKLSLKQIFLQMKPETFKLDPALQNSQILTHYQSFVKQHNRKLFNGDCIRLAGINFSQNNYNLLETVTFILQKAKYFDYLQTNLSLDFKLQKNELSLREKIHIQQQNHCLEPLESSCLANILGINILLVTQEGALILQKRSSSTLIRPNEICSSASGTVEPKDIPSSYFSLDNYSFLEHLLRELTEEIGINAEKINQAKVSFLGITRELIRGGTPELFFIIYTDLSCHRIQQYYQQSEDKFESQKLIILELGKLAFISLESSATKEAFEQKLAHFLSNHFHQISDPLWVHLWLWYRQRIASYVPT